MIVVLTYPVLLAACVRLNVRRQTEYIGMDAIVADTMRVLFTQHSSYP
jgi:hypothetical protein